MNLDRSEYGEAWHVRSDLFQATPNKSIRAATTTQPLGPRAPIQGPKLDVVAIMAERDRRVQYNQRVERLATERLIQLHLAEFQVIRGQVVDEMSAES